MSIAAERHASPPYLAPARPSASHVAVRIVIVMGAAAIVLMWWLDPSTLHGAGAAVTAAGRLAGLLGRTWSSCSCC